MIRLDRDIRRTFCALPLLLALITWAVQPRCCQAAMDEGNVRAAVILHIIALTQWPSGQKPVHIVILGEDPGGVAAILDTKLRSAATGTEPPVRVSLLTAPDPSSSEVIAAVRDCQLLYLTRDGMRALNQLPLQPQERPVLTIGETSEFCENGTGMICLTIVNQKLAIRIHNQLAQRAGFHFSAELLRHAVLVEMP